MKPASEGPILVLGGTGDIGRHVVHSLLDKEKSVRILTRRPSEARRIVGPEPELVEGNIESSESVARALAGVSALIIGISAFSPRGIRRLIPIERDAVLDVVGQASDRGVSRLVYLSVFDVRTGLKSRSPAREIAAIKAGVEETLARSRFNWTVLGLAPSTELFFRMIRGNAMTVPGGGPPALPTVAPEDVGEICARAVLREDLHGRRFRLVGPEAVSFSEAAVRISKVAGREIRFRKVPLILPRIAALATRPFTRFNDTVLFLNKMLGFIVLLNDFPQDVAAETPAMHKLLVQTFGHTPTTLEGSARRWVTDSSRPGEPSAGS